ncbi:mitochondrial inner membrane protease ATP23 homolog [Saccostrea echinata]|uniref:mitochondrial inner membrane protease ATP23 homolog n=1 Tax=Saccostrea echinata TaxID=191078 RepID=UPI002A7F6D9C|nr:mitochondrial inner membrane protease ATP23 homolog [Saccostrea echinata]
MKDESDEKSTKNEGLRESFEEDYGYPLYPERKNPQLYKEYSTLNRRSVTVIEKKIVKCFTHCPELRILREALKDHGCDFSLRRNISVEKCEKKVSGGYDPNTNQIVLCHTNIPPSATCKLLFHEMTHAFDDCRAKVDFTNIEHLACTEIRAAAFADCGIISSLLNNTGFDIRNKHKDCVRKHALRSILTTRNITEEKGRQVIDGVFDKCYSDVTPFDSHKLSDGGYYDEYLRMKNQEESRIPKFRFF